jgi:hypothetical protein
MKESTVVVIPMGYVKFTIMELPNRGIGTTKIYLNVIFANSEILGRYRARAPP